MRLLIVVAVVFAFGGLSSFLSGCNGTGAESASPEQHKGHAMPAGEMKGQKDPTAEGEKTKMKPQELCPVMGGKIDREIYADHEGKRVYFCCAACIDTFKSDPEKYLKILKNQGVEPEEAP